MIAFVLSQLVFANIPRLSYSTPNYVQDALAQASALEAKAREVQARIEAKAREEHVKMHLMPKHGKI